MSTLEARKAPSGEEWLVASQVAARYKRTVSWVHQMCRAGRIPYLQLQPRGVCLFSEDDLAEWLDGADLETIEIASGGRIVRPKDSPLNVEATPPRATPTKHATSTGRDDTED